MNGITGLLKVEMKISRDDQKMVQHSSMAVGQRKAPLSILGGRACLLPVSGTARTSSNETSEHCLSERFGSLQHSWRKHGSATPKTSTKHQPQPSLAGRKSYQKTNKSESQPKGYEGKKHIFGQVWIFYFIFSMKQIIVALSPNLIVGIKYNTSPNLVLSPQHTYSYPYTFNQQNQHFYITT